MAILRYYDVRGTLREEHGDAYIRKWNADGVLLVEFGAVPADETPVAKQPGWFRRLLRLAVARMRIS